jgi:GDP-4-dehydro-6-deoxy-D-mannose reductase
MMGPVLITGVRGFCARHLIDRLKKEDFHSLLGADIHPDPLHLPNLSHYIRVDFTNFSQVIELIHSLQPDVIFHLAGMNTGPDFEMYQVNFMGTVYLLEAVRRVSPHSRMLIVGSAAEYGIVLPERMPISETLACNPIGAYGISKHAMVLAAQDYARNHNVQVVIARPFNIVGRGISNLLVIGAILDRIKQGLQSDQDPIRVAVGNLDSKRDFITVEDTVDAYLQLIQGGFWGEIFNICTGEPRSIRSILQTLISYSSRRIILEVDPALIRPSEVQQIFGSPDKARRAFGFKPKIPFELSLKAAWDEAMNNGR